MARPDRDQWLLPVHVVDRIVVALARGDQDGLKKGYDQAIFRLKQLPPPEAYSATPVEHLRRQRTEQLIHLLAIAIGWYDGTLQGTEDSAKRHSPAEAEAVARVIAARRNAKGRSP